MAEPHDSTITYFARTNHRNKHKPFGIRRRDRRSHIYVIGKTGTGKSTLLETIMTQDIASGEGMALLDPHGELAERMNARVPEHRRSDAIYFDAPSEIQPYGYNPLRYVHSHRRPLSASGMLEVFQKLWPEAWGVRMEHVLRNALLALLDMPSSTLADLPRLLLDKTFRSQAIERIENGQVRFFWEQEFNVYSERYRADSIAPILNKVDAFLTDPKLHRILTSAEKPLHLRRIMDEGTVLLVNLSKGRMGEDSSSLLGGLLMTTLGLAAFSRADIPEEKRRLFFIVADEFQDFTTLAVANMVAELRKSAVSMLLSHQYLHQLAPDVRHAVIGNAGTLISFRLGAEDAAIISKEFQSIFNACDLIGLPNYNIYLKLMIDGAPSRPFSAETMRPELLPQVVAL